MADHIRRVSQTNQELREYHTGSEHTTAIVGCCRMLSGVVSCCDIILFSNLWLPRSPDQWTRKSMQNRRKFTNQNLRTDLRWVVKWLASSRKSLNVVNFTHIRMTCDQLVKKKKLKKIRATCVRI